MYRILKIACGIACLSTSVFTDLFAQDFSPHTHDALEIESAPIINRLPLRTRQIRRLVEQPDGALLIAEWETGSLIRLTPDGTAQRLVEGLNQPSGIANGGSGEIFVTLYAAGMPGSGALIQVNSMGEVIPLVENLNSPSDVVMSPQGDLVFCEYSTGRVFRWEIGGERELLTEEISTPTALAHDSNGTLYIASHNEGAIYRRTFDGTLERIEVGLQHPSDLVLHRSGLLMILNSQTGLITAWNPQSEKSQSFARVPAETTCFSFNSEDNFIIGHWNYDFLMRITRHLTIPCPHCEQRIPLNLIPPANVASPDASL
ncbi:MAG: hypothetical protein HUJ26_11340 [Planctomycetaceae bacterium]|nr:hypothetical protein [Planctomycetaceae bacterium]